MPARDLPAAANVDVLRQGIELLTRLDDATFRHAVGPQLRHTLDFYASFLRGLATRRIDYDTRERDPLVESSRRIVSSPASVGCSRRTRRSSTSSLRLINPFSTMRSTKPLAVGALTPSRAPSSCPDSPGCFIT